MNNYIVILTFKPVRFFKKATFEVTANNALSAEGFTLLYIPEHLKKNITDIKVEKV